MLLSLSLSCTSLFLYLSSFWLTAGPLITNLCDAPNNDYNDDSDVINFLFVFLLKSGTFPRNGQCEYSL